jgi:hypothetical protein
MAAWRHGRGERQRPYVVIQDQPDCLDCLAGGGGIHARARRQPRSSVAVLGGRCRQIVQLERPTPRRGCGATLVVASRSVEGDAPLIAAAAASPAVQGIVSTMPGTCWLAGRRFGAATAGPSVDGVAVYVEVYADGGISCGLSPGAASVRHQVGSPGVGLPGEAGWAVSGREVLNDRLFDDGEWDAGTWGEVILIEHQAVVHDGLVVPARAVPGGFVDAEVDEP